MDDQEIQARLRHYKAVAQQRAQLNKKPTCNKCHGTGRTSKTVEGSLVYETCDKCNGKGVSNNG